MTEQKQNGNALTMLATRLHCNSVSLEKTLMATAFRPVKVGDQYRPVTREEFISLVIVCNVYGLNPITKEIYAYYDSKTKIVIPVVSTDGWNKIMLRQKDYKKHSYRFAKELKTMPSAKPCPEWIECTIEKADGSKIKVREYLDECFRELNYKNPWQTHTKRMLRHKAKIQCAREVFGFGGIYDEDEAQRIIEGTLAQEKAELPAGKPEVAMPESKGKKEDPPPKKGPEEEKKEEIDPIAEEFKPINEEK